MDEINFVLVQLGENKIGLFEAPCTQTFIRGELVGVLYHQKERVCKVIDNLLLVQDTDKSNFVYSAFGYNPGDPLPRIMYRVTYTPMIYEEEL